MREASIHTHFVKSTRLPKWRAGRYIIWLDRKDKHRSLSFEWDSGLHSWLGFKFKWGGEERDLQTMLGLGFITIWFTPEGWCKYKTEYSTGIMYYRGAITFNLWTPERLFGKPLPWYKERSYYINPWERVKDRVLGKKKYSTEVISEHNEVITLEKDYPVLVSMQIATWKRPRWFPMRLYRPELEMLVPIPFPGKGENSWDCGDDAVHSTTMAGRKTPYTVKEVLERERDLILKCRNV